jgi:hypothetical protein
LKAARWLRSGRPTDGGASGGGAAAAVEFITGPLLEALYRVGKPLRDTLSGPLAVVRTVMLLGLFDVFEEDPVVKAAIRPARRTTTHPEDN